MFQFRQKSTLKQRWKPLKMKAITLEGMIQTGHLLMNLQPITYNPNLRSLERKKMQNVEAARRYRDKKKAEENKVEEEERLLLKKNSELKETLNGIEGELNTIKKLMTELGLIKLVTPKTSHVRR